jgi:hypothetical protein
MRTCLLQHFFAIGVYKETITHFGNTCFNQVFIEELMSPLSSGGLHM